MQTVVGVAVYLCPRVLSASYCLRFSPFVCVNKSIFNAFLSHYYFGLCTIVPLAYHDLQELSVTLPPFLSEYVQLKLYNPAAAVVSSGTAHT